MADLKNPRVLYLKAALFVVLGCLTAVLLILQSPTLRTCLLLAVCIWAFARAYYFAFYVVQHYIDPSHRFAGLVHFTKYVIGRPTVKSDGNTSHQDPASDEQSQC